MGAAMEDDQALRQADVGDVKGHGVLQVKATSHCQRQSNAGAVILIRPRPGGPKAGYLLIGGRGGRSRLRFRFVEVQLVGIGRQRPVWVGWFHDIYYTERSNNREKI